jgi:hypothetical protein
MIVINGRIFNLPNNHFLPSAAIYNAQHFSNVLNVPVQVAAVEIGAVANKGHGRDFIVVAKPASLYFVLYIPNVLLNFTNSGDNSSAAFETLSSILRRCAGQGTLAR